MRRRDRVRRVVVVRLGSLGNVLFTFPAVYVLRDYFPRARIFFLTSWEYLPLVEMGGVGEGVGLRRRFAGGSGLRFLLGGRDFLWGLFRIWRAGPPQIFFDFQGFGETHFLSYLSLSGCRAALIKRSWLRYFFTHSVCVRPRSLLEHQCWESLRLLERVGLPIFYQAPSLRVDSCTLEGKFCVGLYIGSSQGRKCWLVENFLELGQRLRKGGVGVYILLGWEYRFLLDQLSVDFPVFCPEDLWELARILGGLDVLVGGDTGPLHMAAALGVAVVGLYRREGLHRYAPLTERRYLLVSSEVFEISVEEVERAVWRVFELFLG